MARRWQQTVYTPRNPHKYRGDHLPFARSSWELSYMEYFDNNPGILSWASEPFFIRYISPVDGKLHKYYPDFYVTVQSPDGEVHRELIEVKPASQTRASRARKTIQRTNDERVLAVNKAKWQAAAQWCQVNGVIFRLLTDRGDLTLKAVVAPARP